MSEPAQPLSRRERRALEEAARAAEGEVTQALPVASDETISILSRRERRRLERLAQPMETWTAEEEMIATGQMPAMTPEVIAEQERLAREKAAQADAEARAAAAYAEVAEQVPAQPEAVAETQPQPDVVAETQPVPEPDVVAETQPERTPEPQSYNDIPADLRHLFPPGSLQARALEAKEAAKAAAPDPNAADEIRRLTQEAMAGITRASTGATPATGEPTESQAESEAATQPVPDLPDGVDVEALWNAPTVDEPVRTSVFGEAAEPPASEAETVEPAAEPEPVRLGEVPLVQDVPVPQEPQQNGSETAVPVWSALVPAMPTPHQGFAASPQPTPAQQAPAQPAPSMWDSHPLTHPGATPVRELPAEPATQSLPRPDLSALLNTQANPTVGQQAELRSTEPLTSAGAMPQRLAEPQAGGGARHFRWAHLAIIGAIAFVLGVLAWNIARSGS